MNCVQTQGGRLDRESGKQPRSSERARGDGGAALVEMGIVSIILFALVFGIIDFGWAFMRNIDTRHGAREIARLAVVNYDGAAPNGAPQSQRLVNEGCTRMDGANSDTDVELDVTGDEVKVTVTQDFDALTGFYDSFLPSTITSSVTMYVEQEVFWAEGTFTCGA